VNQHYFIGLFKKHDCKKVQKKIQKNGNTCGMSAIVDPTKHNGKQIRTELIIAGDKVPCTEPVHVLYMVVLCPEYQHFPESEHAKFFWNILNNVLSWHIFCTFMIH
jgi:hypothetical protein